jgi:hypothetical protein
MHAMANLNLSFNKISNLGNFTMMGENLRSLEFLRLNSNRLVLCDAFFNEITKMPTMKILDIKSAMIPCLCDLTVSESFSFKILVFSLFFKHSLTILFTVKTLSQRFFFNWEFALKKIKKKNVFIVRKIFYVKKIFFVKNVFLNVFP